MHFLLQYDMLLRYLQATPVLVSFQTTDDITEDCTCVSTLS